MKQIDFYCKKCKKSLKMSYVVSGNNEMPVLQGIVMRCHTNKCNRVMALKNDTEGKLIARMDKENKAFI